MKKIITLMLSIFIICGSIFAQTNSTIDLTDDVYELLRTAETRNLCGQLSNVRPYTQKYVLEKLNEILLNLENSVSTKQNQIEKTIVLSYIKNYSNKDGLDLSHLSWRYSTNNNNFPISFEFNDSINGMVSTGLYDNSKYNSTGYELWNSFNFIGDFGKSVSYRASGFIGLTKMPLQYMGDYDIGEWLYSNRELNQQDKRIIHTYKNTAVLPYSYKKFWDGSIYYLSNVGATGLKGWPFDNSLGFGMFGEIYGSFCDNHIEIGLNRVNREWAAMDKGSSLVLNESARPFFGFETKFNMFKWLSFSMLTGVLEFPNQSHILEDAYYDTDENGKRIDENPRREDYYFFQNAFSLAMLDLNFKYFHLDFGSSCIWPKRFELGYAFPLIDRVVYQNDVGDYDNLALFGDMKFIYPGIGSIWISGYLDEVSVFKIRFWEKTRAMYALQAGTKVTLPFIPFTTVSFRYTKVEPYCYTHQSINYTSWYDHYINEAYLNNGESLGYYLPPNSDEFHFRIESKAFENTTLALQYQLIRHGVDWGSGAGIGNNLYSELRDYDRDDLYKYFLKDGTYEWSNVISIFGSYNFRKFNVPVKVYANFGYIINWFTEVNGEPGWDATYSRVSNDEYQDKNGFVLTVGFTIN